MFKVLTRADDTPQLKAFLLCFIAVSYTHLFRFTLGQLIFFPKFGNYIIVLILQVDFSLRENENLFFAGQLTGVEGYMESAASGILAGINLSLIHI